MALVLGLHGKSRRVTTPNDLPLGGRHPKAQGSPQALDVPLALMPSFLSKQCRDTAIAVSRMLVAEFNKPLEETLLPRALLLGAIPVARPRNLQDMADLPATS